MLASYLLYFNVFYCTILDSTTEYNRDVHSNNTGCMFLGYPGQIDGETDRIRWA